MHETATDRLARCQQAELAAGIQRDRTRRAEDEVITAMFAAFAAAADATDVVALPRLRENFVAARIKGETMVGNMAPGSDRCWVNGFLQLSRIWSDLAAPVTERNTAGHLARGAALGLCAARGLTWGTP